MSRLTRQVAIAFASLIVATTPALAAPLDIPGPLEADEIPPAPTAGEIPRTFGSPVPIPRDPTPVVPIPRDPTPVVPIPRNPTPVVPAPPEADELGRATDPLSGLERFFDDTRWAGNRPLRCIVEIDGDQRSIRCRTTGPRRPKPRAIRPSSSNAGACGSHEEAAVVELLNRTRRAEGLAPLRCDVGARLAARAHSADMCRRGYFSHHSPEGERPWDRLQRAGVRLRTAGENIARGQPTADAVHRSWLASPGHRRNILRPHFTRVGVGLVRCGGSTPYWTELFVS